MSNVPGRKVLMVGSRQFGKSARLLARIQELEGKGIDIVYEEDEVVKPVIPITIYTPVSPPSTSKSMNRKERRAQGHRGKKNG